MKETLLKGEISLQNQVEGAKQILGSKCNIKPGKSCDTVQSDYFSEVRFTSVDQTWLQLGSKDYRYLRIKGKQQVPIT